MNHLLAKLRGKKRNYVKILSERNIFEHPQTLNNCYKYDPGTVLEEDDWFRIENFSSEEYCIKLLKHKFVSSEYAQITKSEFSQIDYLVSYQDGNYYFQKLAKNHILKKRYFTISPEPTFCVNNGIIIINDLPDTCYISREDALYFKNLRSITGIFPGIEVLYKEATEAETIDFLNLNFISLQNGFSADKVKQLNRKRIKIALEALNQITKEQQKDMNKYISGYCQQLYYDEHNNTFNISSEDELKFLLFGIDQRFYTTQFGMEKRLANSIVSLE